MTPTASPVSGPAPRGPGRTRQRLRRGLLPVLATLAVATVLGPTAGGASATTTTSDADQPLVAAAATPSVTVTGHGYGHGRGMGQWGALGYAVDDGWSAAQILDHYYGGTTAGTVAPGRITVHMTANDNVDTIVLQERGHITTDAPAPPGWQVGPAVRVARIAGQLLVFDGASCTGPWRQRPAAVTGSVTISPTVENDDRTEMLQLCVPDGTRWLRGAIRSVDTGSALVTVNDVPVEGYLRGVVPREMPASWASLGGGRGAAALQAQAVAARSYALAENRSSYAKTCDTTSCQVYGGRAQQINGVFTDLEDPRADAAVAATANEVRLRGGAVMRTEFSSSTGGWTAGGTFPAVPDDGDDIASNPWHTWTRTIAVADIERRYGKGTLVRIDVTGRDGHGPDGGRPTTVVLTMSGGTVTQSAAAVRTAFGLPSDWISFDGVAAGDAKTVPAGGWLLDADGRVTAFGSAPPLPTPDGVAPGTARGLVVPDGAGTAVSVLTSDGALHASGPGAPSMPALWPGDDLARDVALRSDGRSGWILDAWGGLQPFGGAPAVYGTAWTPGVDSARRLVVRDDGLGGYVLTGDGQVHPFGTAPAVGTVALLPGRTAVGLLLGADDASATVVDDAGTRYPTGPGGPVEPAGGPAPTVDAAARADGTTGFTVGPDATLRPTGSSEPVPAADLDRAVRIALVGQPAGYTLDLFGGLHPFGGARPIVTGPYWQGQDVARSLALGPGGAGVVMDVYGGLHAVGTAASPAPVLRGDGPYWPGWAMARDVALLPGRTDAGYVLDAWGGIHPFGGAPAVRGGGYWPGQDLARAITLLPDGGGYQLDAWGGIHPFAPVGSPLPPTAATSGWWPGQDVARGITVRADGSGWTVDDIGGIHPFLGAPGVGSYWLPGADRVVGLAADPATGWAVYAERTGALHTAPPAAPPPVGASVWPGGDIVRDIAVSPPA